MIIGIDIDGTLFDVLTPTLLEYNFRHGTDFKPEQVTTYKIQDCLNIDKDEFYEILNYVWINLWEEIKPYEAFVDNYLNSLRNNGKNKIVIVTKRDLKTLPNVINLLKKWKIKIDGVVCVNNGIEKSLVNIDILLDDSKEITDSLEYTSIVGILIKREYNKEYDVESIKEFVDMIKDSRIYPKLPHLVGVNKSHRLSFFQSR